MKPLILIPAYNESASLPQVIESLGSQWDILVVDDGSTDGTELCHSNTLSLESNQGYGEAILSGLAEASRQGYSHGILMDADGQHQAADVGKVFEILQQYPEDFISGNRYGISSEVIALEAPPERRSLNREISDFLERIIAQEIPDVFCGLIGLPLTKTLGLPLKGRGYGFTLELWTMVGLMEHKVRSVDIDRVYLDQNPNDWAPLAERRKFYLDVIHQTWSVYSEEYVPLS